ncbi:hypothetical protein BOO91_14545 [Vibrio navarrensis]|uniref:hypothetical protein n=1 Tax=Vibrio navarrensis TaxID=29495 RepID=UPI001866EEEF|nr:hypothetical protein [Vibrio navarrensis]MBE3662149.1 hypothetical protein [Vibrio navarrensis]
MTNKHLFFIALLLIASSVAAFFELTVPKELISTLFTVNSIMFSLGLGLIVSFNMGRIKNRSYIKTIRANIAKVKNTFMLLFGISVCFFIANSLHTEAHYLAIFSKKITFSMPVFTLLIIIYSAFYFVVNFIEIQKLNDSIFDRLLDEE